MKNISEIIRLISARFSDTRQEGEEPTLRRESYAHSNAGPTMSEDEPNSRHQLVNRDASDAARKLWCSADHF